MVALSVEETQAAESDNQVKRFRPTPAALLSDCPWRNLIPLELETVAPQAWDQKPKVRPSAPPKVAPNLTSASRLRAAKCKSLLHCTSAPT